MSRRSLRTALVVVAASLALATSALAQDNEIVENDRVEFQKKTVIDFSDVSIEGELTKPEGSYIKNRKKTRFRNLIALRGDFRPEMKRSVSRL